MTALLRLWVDEMSLRTRIIVVIVVLAITAALVVWLD
jgi:hypothetical protein